MFSSLKANASALASSASDKAKLVASSASNPEMYKSVVNRSPFPDSYKTKINGVIDLVAAESNITPDKKKMLNDKIANIIATINQQKMPEGQQGASSVNTVITKLAMLMENLKFKDVPMSGGKTRRRHKNRKHKKTRSHR